jgi:hypothetical protein
MSDTIFVIKNENGIISFFNNLEKAKTELKNIYKKTVDFKHYDYQINEFVLINNEFVFTNTTYKYFFDKFTENTK